jgi:hypothetical protein
MPTTPKSERTALAEDAAVVFDADALFAEFQAKTQPFRFRGETFHLPPPEVWPDTLDQATTLLDISTAILGQDEANRYREVGGSVKFLQALIKTLHGLDMGESRASSDS